MRLSGTPNEKALIALCAYIIGFTTAYIFYFQLDEIQSPVTSNQSASVMQATIADTESITQATIPAQDFSSSPSSVFYENGRLLVDDGASEAPTLLSISSDIFVDEEVVLEQGVHESRPSFVHFSDRDMVLFCESIDKSGDCNLFLYDINSQLLQPLRDANGDIATYNTRLQLPVTYEELISYTRSTNLTF